MLSARHLPVWNESLPSTLGGSGFREPGLRALGSLDMSASHLLAEHFPASASCLVAERDGDGIQNPTLPMSLSSLTADKGKHSVLHPWRIVGRILL